MKKIFLGLLALAGMVAGFTLTSCGGGGGSETQYPLITGRQLVAGSGAGAGYVISFNQYLGNNAYVCEFADIAHHGTATIMVTLTQAELNANKQYKSFKASVSSGTFEPNESIAFWSKFANFGANVALSTVVVTEAITMTYNVEDKTLKWTGEFEITGKVGSSDLEGTCPCACTDTMVTFN